MSKLSFRARALDASRPMPVFLAEHLPDLPDHSAISRAVPAMPTGMEKDEECEHHLQRAICAGLIIPTPEVSDMADGAAYDRLYPSDYRMPRQLIHMQPLGLEQEVPDYDMDSEDERWLRRQHAAANGRASELTELKFEETMEKLERGSGQTVVTLREARALAGRTGLADHILAAVYDYWLNKRLATQQPLLLAVRTEPRPGAPQASPYLAFRRRTEKMQTRKNRKNDESSYEKMVKLRRHLSAVITLLDLIRQRENTKRESVQITASILEKRFIVRDFSGHILAEAAAARPAVAPTLLTPPFTTHHRPTNDAAARQRDKRQYKRRKHRHHSSIIQSHTIHHGGSGSSSSSEAEVGECNTVLPPDMSGPFTFRRKPGCQYHMPRSFDLPEQVPWMTDSSKENTYPGQQEAKKRYVLTSVDYPKPRCLGFVRRRIGRGGRVILDRLSGPNYEERLWASLGYTVTDSQDLRQTVDPADLCNSHKSHSSMPDSSDMPNAIECETSRSINRKLDVDSLTFDEVKFKTELSKLSPYEEKTLSTPDKFVSGVTIKSEIEEIQYSDSDKLSRLDVRRQTPSAEGDVSNVECENGSSDRDSLSSCDEHDYYDSKFRFKGSAPDRSRIYKKYRNKRMKLRDSRKMTANMYREDMKVMAELLMTRRLARYEQRVPDIGSSCVDNFLKDEWGNRLHFKPKQPDHEEVNSLSSEMVGQEEEAEQLTEHSPIAVHVRLTLPDLHQPPSDLLFSDTSPFVTSEFTLADIYGDSIIDPNPDNDDSILNNEPRRSKSPDVSWRQSNGPVKLEKTISFNTASEDANLLENVDETSKSFKGELSENSSSNQTSVFLSSEGSPPSAASVNSDIAILSATDESNHEVTNGVIFECNDSNESDKLKQAQKKLGNTPTKFKPMLNSVESGASTIIKVDPVVNNQKIYSERSISPSLSTSQQLNSRFISFLPMEKLEQKKTDTPNQNVAIVQLKSPTMLRQSKTQQVLKSVLTTDGTEVRTPLLVTQTSRQGGSPVRKTDTVRVRGVEDIVTGSGQQQVVTLAMTDTLKLRLHGHLMGGGAGTASSSTHDLLGLVQQKALPTASVPRDGISGGARRAVVQVPGAVGRPVRLLRPLSVSQRSRLLSPTVPLQLRGLTNIFQLQMRTAPHRRTEILEVAPQPVEAASPGSATSGTGGDAGPAPAGPAPAAGPPPPAPGKPPPPPSRKGQSSLPMEVT